VLNENLSPQIYINKTPQEISHLQQPAVKCCEINVWFLVFIRSCIL